MLDAAKDGANLSALDSAEGGSAETVKPGDVDAFWLQRVLNKHYNDADISQVRECGENFTLLIVGCTSEWVILLDYPYQSQPTTI